MGLGDGLRAHLRSGSGEIEYEASQSTPPPVLESQPKEVSDPFLVAFGLFSIITALSALLCTAVNVISVVRSFKAGTSVFEGILRCYAVGIALFVAVAETEWERIFKLWRVLEYWVGRGMLQIFVGVMTKALEHTDNGRPFETVLAEISSGMLLGCGAIYVLAGLLCLGSVKRSHMRKAQSKEQAIKDLEELERRRNELHNILAGKD